jgi:hypothetical protein
MCFGGGDDSGEKMLKLQKKQAKEAREKEAARQKRIKEAMGKITTAFEGGPVMETKKSNFDWSKFDAPTSALLSQLQNGANALGSKFRGNSTPFDLTGLTDSLKAMFQNVGSTKSGQVSGLPEGYSYVQLTKPSGSGTQEVYRQNNVGGGYTREQRPSGVTTVQGSGNYLPGTYGIKGPDGKVYKPGDALPFEETVDTGQVSGGFNDDFYNTFKQGMIDYYAPQVADKYGEAKDELTYRLARAGTGRSSAANSAVADLAKQNTLNTANVYSEADAGAADLRTRVANERTMAENQVYATEDPTIGVNQALAAVKNISLDQPKMTPLGEIFKVALVGGANAMTGYKNQKTINEIQKASNNAGSWVSN